MAALYKTITLCTPPIIDIGIIQRHRATTAARYNIYTGETIVPPLNLPVWVVIEADTANLSSVHTTWLPDTPCVSYFVSFPPWANQCVQPSPAEYTLQVSVLEHHWATWVAEQCNYSPNDDQMIWWWWPRGEGDMGWPTKRKPPQLESRWGSDFFSQYWREWRWR